MSGIKAQAIAAHERDVEIKAQERREQMEAERSLRVMQLQSLLRSVLGQRDDLELRTLAAINEACRLTVEADVLKRIADWVRDSGDVDTLAEQIEISPWLMRQWREVHAPDAFSMEAA